MNKLKKWYNKNKDVPLFKAKLLAVFMVLLAIAVEIYSDFRDRNETVEINENTAITEETAEPEKEDLVLSVYKNSKAHIIVFFGLTAVLIVVKSKQKQKLKESQ